VSLRKNVVEGVKYEVIREKLDRKKRFLINKGVGIITQSLVQYQFITIFG